MDSKEAVPIYCTLTRIRLRHLVDLPGVIMSYIRIRHGAKDVPSLRRTALLFHGPRTLMILSIWAGGPGTITLDTAVPSHVDAARRAFFKARRVDSRPEIWSTQWRLTKASRNATWGGDDSAFFAGHEWPQDPDVARKPRRPNGNAC